MHPCHEFVCPTYKPIPHAEPNKMHATRFFCAIFDSKKNLQKNLLEHFIQLIRFKYSFQESEYFF